MLKLNSFGSKNISLLPTKTFSVFALVNFEAKSTQAKCCGLNPGFCLFALMFFNLKGFFVNMLNANAVLKIWPPPLP